MSFLDQPAFARLKNRRVLEIATAIALCVVLLMAIHLRFFKMPRTPITDRDTWGYFHPALAVFFNGTFEQSERQFLYPGFTLLVMRAKQNVDFLAAVQSVIGLIGGAFLWLAWMKLRRFFAPERFAIFGVAFAHALLGILMIAVYLLSLRRVVLEHTIRPEAIFPSVSAFLLWLSLVFLDEAFLKKKRTALLWLQGTLILFASSVLYLLKPQWGVSLIFAALPLVVVFFAGSYRVKFAMIAAAIAGVALSYFALFLPEEKLNEKFNARTMPFLPTLMFCIHANIIYPELLRDIESPSPPYDRAFLQAVADDVKYALTNPPGVGVYPSLGFDPDYIIYRSKAMRLMESHFDGDPKGYGKFCEHYYFMAVRHQPLAMVKKVLGELRLFYRLRGNVTDCLKNFVYTVRYSYSLNLLDNSTTISPDVQKWDVLKRYRDEVAALADSEERVHEHKLVTMLQKFLDVTYLLVLFAFVVIGLIFRKMRTVSPTLFSLPPLFVGLWLFSFNFGLTLTTALTHSMKVSRYTDVQFAFTVFSYFAAALWIVVFVLEFLRARKIEAEPARERQVEKNESRELM